MTPSPFPVQGREVLIRLVNRDEWQACNDFYNRLHGRGRTLRQWEWEFSERQATMYIVALESGSIRGTQALMPMDAISRRGLLRTAKSEETLLDPEIRGRGILSALYAPLLDAAQQSGIEVVWGFTPAVAAFQSVGFHAVGRVGQLLLPFASDAFRNPSVQGAGRTVFDVARACGVLQLFTAAIRHRAEKLTRAASCAAQSFEIRTLSAAPDGSAHLCQEFVEQWGGVTLLRDREFLDWRIFRNPYVSPVMRAAYHEGDLIGWMIHAVGRDGLGYIVDAVVASHRLGRNGATAALRSLLIDAVGLLGAQGVSGIRAWSATSHDFDRSMVEIARSLGFLRIRLGMPIVMRAVDGTSLHTEVPDTSEWYITRIFTEGTNG